MDFRVAHNTISKIIRQMCDAILVNFFRDLFPILKRQMSRRTPPSSSATDGSCTIVLVTLEGKHIEARLQNDEITNSGVDRVRSASPSCWSVSLSCMSLIVRVDAVFIRYYPCLCRVGP
ncbi:hypothetical protein DPMN_066784 [Dreissena polymorpha]|uniref:Uncharacterized protein n=1 Tax=Dreissena polymorpha TaxID=45954 RepID=A0A9D3YYK3_DREPO|nr:hypothetical protein DPMN_066784 [Dreissena polymorpha]